MCAQRKDESMTWIPMKYLKSSNPVKMVEFEISRSIKDEPDFSWWILTVIKKCRRVISKLKTDKRHAKLMKFGIKMSKNMKKFQVLDAENEIDL